MFCHKNFKFTNIIIALHFCFYIVGCNMTWNQNLNEWLEEQINAWNNRVPKGMLFVSSTGNDTTGNGKKGNPWKTVSHAIRKMSDDSLSWTVHLIGNIVEDATITIDSNINAKEIFIEGESKSDSLQCDSLLITGKDVTLENMTLKNESTNSTDNAITVSSNALMLNDVVLQSSKKLINGVSVNGENAKVIMTGESLIEGFNVAVDIGSGNFTMKDGTIGTLVIYDKTGKKLRPDSDNYTNMTGVKIATGGSFTMDGGYVSWNLDYGVENQGQFTMTGGEVRCNSKGVKGSISMGGNARIGYFGSTYPMESNYIELGATDTITVISNLTNNYAGMIDADSNRTNALIVANSGQNLCIGKFVINGKINGNRGNIQTLDDTGKYLKVCDIKQEFNDTTSTRKITVSNIAGKFVNQTPTYYINFNYLSNRPNITTDKIEREVPYSETAKEKEFSVYIGRKDDMGNEAGVLYSTTLPGGS
ncbi:MAG: hypothetical protein IJR49_06030 [Treponema sp.]|nr:hypothetical protein [Treponema sp.]